MCKVSEETILRANDRMRKYKIGQGQATAPASITVNTHVHGRTYRRTFTEKYLNDIFGRILSSREHGKAL